MNARLLGGLAILWALAMPASPEAGWAATLDFQEDPGSETAAASETAPFTAPEAHVAAMVREALRKPENIEAWRCLDLALTEMNAPVGDGQDPSSQALRAADSLACANGSIDLTASSSTFPPTRPGGPEGESWSSDLSNGAWQRVLPSIKNMWTSLIEIPWVFPVLLLVSSGALAWFGRSTVLELLGQKREAYSGRDPEPLRRGPENPVAMALALWEGGLPSPEIARRTGLAQDALSVLLNLKTDGTPVRAEGPAPDRGANPYTQTRLERR